MNYMFQKMKYLLALNFVVGINVYTSDEQPPSKFVQRMQKVVAINVESPSKFAQKMRKNKAVAQDELEKPLPTIQKSKVPSSHIRTLQGIRATRAPLHLPVGIAKEDFPSPLDMPLTVVNNEVLHHRGGNETSFSIE